MTFDPKNLDIAVALIRHGSDRIALKWNAKWGSFVLPMTKVDAGPPAESAENAALRAAAEVLQLPVRVVSGQSSKAMRTLQLSDSDGQIKDYHFTVVPVEVHPDFQSTSIPDPGVLFASYKKAHAGEYQPLSPTVKPILDACIEWGWL